MFSILISEKGGETKRLEFDRPEITIGRVQGNDIVLPKGNVSKRHSRIVFKDGKYIIVDLKSTNGTYVNGRKITAPLVVKGTDKIYIGDFIMNIEEGSGPSTSSTADLESAGRPPPPPPRPGGRPAIATVPAIRAEPTSMDVAAGMEDELEEPEESEKSPVPVPESRAARPTPPPAPPPVAPPVSAVPAVPPPPAPPPPLRVSTKPPIPGSSGSDMPGFDRPIMPSDRISDKATMMAGDAPRIPAPPIAPPPGPVPVPAPTLQSLTPIVPPIAPPPVAPPMAATLPIVPPPSAPAGAVTPPPMAIAPPPAGPPPAASAAPPIAPPPVSIPPAVAPPPAVSPVAPPPVSARPPLARATPSTTPAAAAVRPTTRSATPAVGPSSRPVVGSGIEDPQRRRYVEALSQVVTKALDQLGLAAASPEQLSDAEAKLDKATRDIADKIFPLPLGLESDALAKMALAELTGCGPLDELLADESVHEVAVAAPDRVYVDRGNGQSLHERIFTSTAAVYRAIHRMVTRAGGRLDSGIQEIRLDSGALLQVALPPQARVPSLVLRRVRKTGGRLQDLVNQGVLSAAMSEFLEVCMRERRNMIVSGYGRGVMLGALGGATAAGARLVTVEPVSELDLSATTAAWIGLIGRGLEMRSLIGHAVRMHPDHLLITDVRGPEALDVAAALCGGQGVVVGVDAASSREAVGRLESLARLSNESPSRKALREELAQSLNLAVHVGRTAGGAYRVMEISEVILSEEGGIELQPVFTFKPEGGDGQFVATGHVPAFAG